MDTAFSIAGGELGKQDTDFHALVAGEIQVVQQQTFVIKSSRAVSLCLGHYDNGTEGPSWTKM